MYSPSTPMDGSDPLQIENRKRILIAQIICGAMIFGLLVFTAIASIIAKQPKNLPALSYVGLFLGVVCIGCRVVVPGITANLQVRTLVGTDSGELDSRLFEFFQQKMIVGLALLEGPALFNLIAYIAEGQGWTIAVVGLLIFLMAMMFPTLNQFESWAEDRKRDLQNQF